jgi:hypothetical protein
MTRPRLAPLAALVPCLLPACLAGCSEKPETPEQPAAPAAPEPTDAEPTEAEPTDAQRLDAFADTITRALRAGDTAAVIAHIKASNVPDNWRDMIGPMLAEMTGRDLTSEVRDRASFTNEQLQWPQQTPEAFADVEHILVVSYSEPNDSGNQTFPLLLEDGQWWIVIGQ